MKHSETSKMTDLEAIEFRLRQLGIKKRFIAKKVGLTPAEMSHLLSGRRKYQKEKNLILSHLGIEFYTN